MWRRPVKVTIAVAVSVRLFEVGASIENEE
jgi:hypothetical protein